MLDDADDLVAMRVPADKDVLSQLLQDHWPLQVFRHFHLASISPFFANVISRI